MGGCECNCAVLALPEGKSVHQIRQWNWTIRMELLTR
jgi:hypothetical protein